MTRTGAAERTYMRRRANSWSLPLCLTLLTLAFAPLVSGCASAPSPAPLRASSPAPGCDAELRALKRLLGEREDEIESAQDDSRRQALLATILDEEIVEALVRCLADPSRSPGTAPRQSGHR